MLPILRVDLTSGRTDRIDISADHLKEYIGGASLAARLLYDHIRPELPKQVRTVDRVVGLSDDLNSTNLRQQTDQPAADDRRVIDY